jgi:hypothetical protein
MDGVLETASSAQLHEHLSRAHRDAVGLQNNVLDRYFQNSADLAADKLAWKARQDLQDHEMVRIRRRERRILEEFADVHMHSEGALRVSASCCPLYFNIISCRQCLLLLTLEVTAEHSRNWMSEHGGGQLLAMQGSINARRPWVCPLFSLLIDRHWQNGGMHSLSPRRKAPMSLSTSWNSGLSSLQSKAMVRALQQQWQTKRSRLQSKSAAVCG